MAAASTPGARIELTHAEKPATSSGTVFAIFDHVAIVASGISISVGAVPAGGSPGSSPVRTSRR